MKDHCTHFCIFSGNSIIKFVLGILLFSIIPSAVLQASLLDELKHCGDIKQEKNRLTCYDKLSHSKTNSQQTFHFNPPRTFLNSKLRTHRHTDEYRLSVADFVALIKLANLEDNTKISLWGWEKQHQVYTLHLTMNEKLSLSFEHFQSTTENVSVLRPVNHNGEKMEASLFIITIASMTPDE